MTLLVDTSVWSLAFRRDVEAEEPEVQALKEALSGAEVVVTTGIVLQELLQGFSGAKAGAQIIERFSALALIQPDREDHIVAAALRNACRRAGVQVGTVDALIAQLCIRHELALLSTDPDFRPRRPALPSRRLVAEGQTAASMTDALQRGTCA